MALWFQVRGLLKLSSLGFCVVLLIILSIEDIHANPYRDFSIENHKQINTYDRTRRSPEDEDDDIQSYDRSEVESVEDQTVTDSLLDESRDIYSSSSVPNDELSEEEIKPKNSNKQQKPIPNYTKNYSTAKVASNESFNEKQKPGLYSTQSQKYNNFKKLVLDSSDPIQKTNISNATSPHSSKLEKKKVKPSIVLIPANVTRSVMPNITKMNETYLMSDQPVVATNGAQNDTDDEDILDGFSQNTTGTLNNSSITTSADGRTMPSEDGLNLYMVSGLSVGTLVFIGLAAGGGFVVYRRRLWNKPQTLSDKCSNADSSGYIDDSTLRENSEEMYSLDNDSFLNSLEAMTIQNYWTDSVKHTKL